MPPDRRVLHALAELLGYPAAGLAERARACARLAAPSSPAAALRLERFARACGARPPGQLEELYVAAFDLGPVCVPYLGVHLLGEGRARGVLLARLRAMQRAAGVSPGGELPDHVCEVLRLLAAAPDHADRDALLEDGLAPAAAKMLAALEQADHPWADAVGALAEVVRPAAARAGAAAPLEVRP
jgi:nitrate reductase delta subunit